MKACCRLLLVVPQRLVAVAPHQNSLWRREERENERRREAGSGGERSVAAPVARHGYWLEQLLLRLEAAAVAPLQVLLLRGDCRRPAKEEGEEKRGEREKRRGMRGKRRRGKGREARR